MASISEMLIQSGLESSKESPLSELGKGIQQGADLAQNIERLKMQRQQIEQQKSNLRQQKLENMTQDILKARKLGGKALQGYREYLKNKTKFLKLEEMISPESIDLITSVPENIDRFDVIVSQIQSGDMNLQTASEVLKDEGLFYELDPMQRQRLAEAQKTATLEENKMARTERTGEIQFGKQTQAQKAAGPVAFEKATAQAAREYKDQIGNVQFNFNKFKDTYKALSEGDVKTGTGLLKFIGGSDVAVDLTNPDVAAARDSVRSAIVGTLKPILGGAFSEKEGQRILELAFNPKFKAAENAKRVKAEMERVLSMAKRKEDEYVRKGYMTDKERANLSFEDDKKVYDIGGVEMTLDQAKRFFQKNKNLTPPPEVAKALGME